MRITNRILCLAPLFALACGQMTPEEMGNDYDVNVAEAEASGLPLPSTALTDIHPPVPAMTDDEIMAWMQAPEARTLQPRFLPPVLNESNRDGFVASTITMSRPGGRGTYETTKLFWADGTEVDESDPAYASINGVRQWNDGAGSAAIAAHPQDAEEEDVQKAVCTINSDLCAPCFRPVCRGGAKNPAGDEGDGKIGCQGGGATGIAYGGPHCDMLDNFDQTWNIPDGKIGTGCTQGLPVGPLTRQAMEFATGWLNGANTIMPEPYHLIQQNCDSQGEPVGYTHVPGSNWSHFDYSKPVHVDIVLQEASLVPGGALVEGLCPGLPTAGQAQEDFVGGSDGSGVNEELRVLGCTLAFYRLNTNGTIYTTNWNNGFASSAKAVYHRIGNLVTIDPYGIARAATYPGILTDGLDSTTRIYYIMINAISHEIGHSLGMSHAYIGAPGTTAWYCEGTGAAKTCWQNSRKIASSAMTPNIPEAAFTSIGWSSGLATNGVNYDAATTGDGNAEGWRLANCHHAVKNQDGSSVPIHSYCPGVDNLEQ